MGRARVAPWVIFLLAFSLILGACEDDSESAAGPSATAGATLEATNGETPEPGETPLPGADPNSTPAFAEGDEILSIAVQEAATLDPMRIEDPAAVLIARQLFEGLTRWDPVGERVEAAAAESWKVSKKGTVFTFTLRNGMTFHDGTPVTARDFKFAFDRIADKTSASNIAYTLERVQGFQEVNRFGDANALSGVKAIDDRTLQITLSEPYFEFPLVLTHPGLVPVPADAVRDIDEFLSRPTGNGPFQMTGEWGPGETLELKAFSDFWETVDVDGLRFVAYEDAAASWIPFVTGDLDVAEIPADRIDVAVDRFGEDGVLPLLAGYYYGFNVDSKNLKDIDLRRAISRAIDRRSISRSIYNGTMRPPRGIVPSGMPGFDKNACRKLCSFSKGEAIEHLRDVPKKNRNVTIEYTQGQPHRRVARAVAQDLQDIGIEVKVQAFRFPEYLRMLRDGKQEMYRLGWLAEYPSPSVFLSSLFLSTSPDNHTQFVSVKVDKLLRQAGAEKNEKKRTRKYARAERLILRSIPTAPIGTFLTHWAAAERIGNIAWDTMGGFDAAYVELAEEG